MVRQPIREKLDFISLRQAKRLANSTDTPMYLGIIRGIDDFDMQLKQSKIKNEDEKIKTQAGNNAWYDRGRKAASHEGDRSRDHRDTCRDSDRDTVAEG